MLYTLRRLTRVYRFYHISHGFITAMSRLMDARSHRFLGTLCQDQACSEAETQASPGGSCTPPRAAGGEGYFLPSGQQRAGRRPGSGFHSRLSVQPRPCSAWLCGVSALRGERWARFLDQQAGLVPLLWKSLSVFLFSSPSPLLCGINKVK